MKLDINEFKELMRAAELNKKDFAELLNTSYHCVNNWGTNGREYPYWIKSWLDNYIKAKSYDMIKNKVFEIENITATN